MVVGIKALFKTGVLALSLCVITTGCATTNVSMNEMSNSNNQASVSSSNSQSSVSNNNNQASASQPPASNSQASSSTPSDSKQSIAPTGFILDPHCDKGTGSTGLDIYYMQPPSDSQRFVCVHRANVSPYINYDIQFDQNLSNVGGPYCAFSAVDKNVGCALSPITEKDLMNVPPSLEGVPDGYVLEDCQQGVGATGKTIYYNLPSSNNFPTVCVHKVGAPNWIYSGNTRVAGDINQRLPIIAGSYCAYSPVDDNVGCALEPITENDLMNP